MEFVTYDIPREILQCLGLELWLTENRHAEYRILVWFNLNLVQTSFHYSYGSSDLSLSVLLIPINMLYWKISFTRGVSRLWAIIVESNWG
jgi:hypothetical protein